MHECDCYKKEKMRLLSLEYIALKNYLFGGIMNTSLDQANTDVNLKSMASMDVVNLIQC